MHAMFKKVNAKEKILGWYSTGPKIRPADLEINEMIRRYTPQPIFTIIDVNPKNAIEIPAQAYISIENAPEERSLSERTFAHVRSEIGAYEAEEVGVEHLLREIRNVAGSTIADQVQNKLQSLKGLRNHLNEMHTYLENVLAGKMPPNHQIIYQIQDIFNLLPNLRQLELVQSFAVKTNDNLLVIYLCSLIRAIIALHNLITNKLGNRDAEKKEKEEADGVLTDKSDSKEKKTEVDAKKK